jgi:hypothetical protein
MAGEAKKATKRQRAVSPRSGSDITDKQFKKGQSGNPAGMKKGSKNWKTCIREVMDALPSKALSESDLLELGISPKGKMTTRHMVVISQAKAALDGDTRAAQFLADREDGKPQQAIELSGDQDKPVLIINRFNGNSNK